MRWPALLVLSGCNSLLGVHDFTIAGDAADAAAPADTLELDGPADAGNCIGAATGLGPFCQPTPMTGTLQLQGMFATDLCTGGTIEPIHTKMVCLVAGWQVEVANTLRVVGAYPLVILAGDTILVTAIIDVSSRQGLPGAGSGTCTGGSGLSVSSTGSGGGGGSFGGRGGVGGPTAASGGGAANPVQSLATLQLQAGCSGGDGGVGVVGLGGMGGAGGGAVYLAARTSITVQGEILAGGAGGLGGGKGSGGGGGGSGGLIGFDAPAIVIDAFSLLLANGGGGASGNQNNASGRAGGDAVSSTQPAPGGNPTNGNNAGGSGSFGGDGIGGGDSTQLGIGAGAGGGGAGIIFAVGSFTSGGVTSPAIVTR